MIKLEVIWESGCAVSCAARWRWVGFVDSIQEFAAEDPHGLRCCFGGSAELLERRIRRMLSLLLLTLGIGSAMCVLTNFSTRNVKQAFLVLRWLALRFASHTQVLDGEAGVGAFCHGFSGLAQEMAVG